MSEVETPLILGLALFLLLLSIFLTYKFGRKEIDEKVRKLEK